jgi:hypothetical protein
VVSRDSINGVNKRELAKCGSEGGDQRWRRGGSRRRRPSPVDDADRKATSRMSVRILPYVISVMTWGICQCTTQRQKQKSRGLHVWLQTAGDGILSFVDQ